MRWCTSELAGRRVRRVAHRRPLPRRRVEAYRRDLEHFAIWASRLGVHDPAAVDRKMLRRYLAHLATRRYARRSIARKASTLRRYFAWMVHARDLEQDPSIGLSAPTGDARLPHVLRHDEFHVLLDAAVPQRLSGDRCRSAAAATRHARRRGFGVALREWFAGSRSCAHSRSEIWICPPPRVRVGEGRQATGRSGQRSCRSGPAMLAQRRTRCAHGGWARLPTESL